MMATSGLSGVRPSPLRNKEYYVIDKVINTGNIKQVVSVVNYTLKDEHLY